MKRIPKILSKAKTILQTNWAAVMDARKMWPTFEQRLATIVKEFQIQGTTMNFAFPFILHTSSPSQTITTKNNQLMHTTMHRYNYNAVAVGLGNSSLGIGFESETVNLITRKKSQSMAQEVENHAYLSYSQFPNGAVGLFYFPAKSKVAKVHLGDTDSVKENRDIYYLRNVYKNPGKISDQSIVRAIEFLIAFQTYTSAIARPPWNKRLSFRIRFWFYHRKYLGYLGNLGKVLLKLLKGTPGVADVS